ncbi:MAG: DegT/DnrJ/EryC1/StrS family aminotransferase [Actinomycetota bacterium]|nr:DegT/DnrJ/EryC1/StrS family aminotransferase [Actinomycetota bacterium]
MPAPKSVPFLDLGRLHAEVRTELRDAFDAALAASSFVGSGGPVAEFEAQFAAAHDCAWAAGCGSGTDALTLALNAAGIGAGDEVIVPAMTFVATAEAVVHAGATPVLADVDPETLLLSPATVKAARTPRTRAVIPVHLYGHVVPFDALAEWRSEGLVVIEDAAQAHLATWQGRFVGSVGHAACFSFYPGKNLGALGDAGLVLSTDEAIIARVKAMRDHGRKDKYVHDEIGWCSRLDALQARLLLVKLARLEDWTRGRRAVAEQYKQRLAATGALVAWEDGAVHHLLCVRSPDRDGLQAHLRAAGVGCGIHYPVALCDQPCLQAWASECPESTRAAGDLLSLPMDPRMDAADVDYVCDQVLAFGGPGRLGRRP